MMAPEEPKRWLRRFLVRQRQFLNGDARTRKSRVIMGHLLKSRFYRRAKTIAVFLGFASEVQTQSLLTSAWKDRKTVVIPMTSRGFHRPFFASFEKGDALRRSRHGPWELITRKKAFEFRKIDLVLVPGLGFDGDGHRLGYGGGVYDRLLSKTPRADHIGLFYSVQKVHRLPHERHDQRLEAVITERGVERCLA